MAPWGGVKCHFEKNVIQAFPAYYKLLQSVFEMCAAKYFLDIERRGGRGLNTDLAASSTLPLCRAIGSL